MRPGMRLHVIVIVKLHGTETGLGYLATSGEERQLHRIKPVVIVTHYVEERVLHNILLRRIRYCLDYTVLLREIVNLLNPGSMNQNGCGAVVFAGWSLLLCIAVIVTAIGVVIIDIAIILIIQLLL